MHRLIAVIALSSICLSACGSEDAASNQQSTGTVTIDGQTWTFVPSIQCSVYPGNVVSIAGTAAQDPAVEIVIDLGGPNGVSVGSDGDPNSWRAVVDSISSNIDGQRVSGSAEFRRSGSNAKGTFDIRC
ncbi:MAG: hypothetical protein ACR2PZ_00815 [Pseudomonadales bacterium]